MSRLSRLQDTNNRRARESRVFTLTDFNTWLSPECIWLAVFIYFLGVLFVWEIVEVEEPDTEWRVALFWGYCAIMLIYLRLIGKHPPKK